MQADSPATVLCDGDPGLWRIQRGVLSEATVVLDWWHAAVLFEYALQAARGLAHSQPTHPWLTRRSANWSLRSGACGTGAGRDAAASSRRSAAGRAVSLHDVAGVGCFLRRVHDLLGYLARNEDALVHYAARRRRGEPMSTAFAESAVNEIVAKRMNKRRQMRWNRATVQLLVGVRTAALNDTLEDAFRRRYPGPANNNATSAVA